jgi:drug/metabolite transporter (DMT)-like permease
VSSYQVAHNKLDLKAMAVLTVLCASWGFNQVTIKIGNAGVSPVLQGGLRSAGAAVLIWLWMIWRREPLREKDGSFGWGLVVGLLFSIEFLLIYWGLDFTIVSRSVVFLYMMPFVVALGAQLFIPGESLRRYQIMGLCCSFIGIVVAFNESVRLPTLRMLIGDSMLLGAAVLWGATTIVIKTTPLARIKPSKTLLYQLVVSAVMLPLGSIAMGEPGIMKITPLIIGCLAYQTVWVAAITYLAWFWLIQNYPAPRLASFSFFTPLYGVLAGVLLLHEKLTLSLGIALVLVAVGIYLVNRPESLKKQHRLAQ